MNSSPPKRLTLMRVDGKAGQPFGDAVDQAVADRMAERVVDALEVVEVEDDERAAAVMVAGRHHLADDLVEIGAVGEAGQVVEARHRADLLLRIDAQRHVLEDDHAEAAGALARREFEMPAVDQPDQDLAVAPFAQRARQLRLEIAPVLAAEHAARHAAHDQRLQRAAEQRIGRSCTEAPRWPRHWRRRRGRPGSSMTSPCDMVFSARSKRCAIWRAFLWPMTAENSTSRTRSAVPLMMKKNGTISRPSTTSRQVAAHDQAERDRRDEGQRQRSSPCAASRNCGRRR